MRPDIVVPASLWQALLRHLIRVTPQNPYPDEELAFLLVSQNVSPLGLRLVVREMLPGGPSDFQHQSGGGLRPTQEFVNEALNRCNREGWSLIEVHSHPSDDGPGTTFSYIDWSSDRKRMPPTAAMMGEGFRHATMVVGQKGLDAHLYDRTTRTIIPIEQITIVGLFEERNLTHVPTTSSYKEIDQATTPARYHRQELFLGQTTQEALRNATIAIVGLGGLGSFVALELAHLGVGHLILIDPDIVEVTNLNRLLGAGNEDIGQAKVEVYSRLIQRASPTTRVTPLAISILDEEGVNYAKGADVLVGCVDNHGARMILNQIAVRYVIPLIDGGSAVKGPQGRRKLTVGGQVMVVLPGIGCLECRGFINRTRAVFDLASKEGQEYNLAHGYGTQEIAPSVISLNGVIASLQVTEVLYLLAGQATPERKTPPTSMYDALERIILAGTPEASEECLTCSSEGVLAVGDLAPIRRAKTSPVNVPSVRKIEKKKGG